MSQASEVSNSAATYPRKRPNRSCISCRQRKVKCDQVKPCHACCLRGEPSECRYIATDDVRHQISQSDMIERLRAENYSLRKRLLGSQSIIRTQSTSDTYSTLEAKVETIDHAPPNVTGDRVKQIPSGTGRVTIATSEKGLGSSIGSARDGRGEYVSDEYQDFRQEQTAEESDLLSDGQQLRGRARRHRTVISSIPQANKPYMEAFVDRFVDAMSPKNNHNHPVRAAARERIFSPLLFNAFQATSTISVGQSTQDLRIETAGRKIYGGVLAALQKVLHHPQQSRSIPVLITVILLWLFEYIQSSTAEAASKHGHGMLRLLEFRGPQNHILGIGHKAFIELRYHWVMMAVASRSPSFLAREDWKTVPWSAGTSVKDVMQHLLDVVVEIPAYLSKFDTFMDSLQAGNMSQAEVSSTNAALCAIVDGIHARLKRWKRDWADPYPLGQPTAFDTQPAQNDPNPFPTFQCLDQNTMTLITPQSIVYQDLFIAYTLCTFYSTCLILSAADLRTREMGAIQPDERYTWACNICRSIEFFVRNVPGYQISRVLFSIRVAYDTFPEDTIERTFVQRVLVWIGTRYHLRSCLELIPDMSASKAGNSIIS